MTKAQFQVAIIRGDGIGVDVTNSTLDVLGAVQAITQGFELDFRPVDAGAGYFQRYGLDIEPQGEQLAEQADAIFLGAIGLPSVRYADGTEISPHLRLREQLQLYAGVRPVKAYPNVPQRLLDQKANGIDLVILRESTEGLFYSAAASNRGTICSDTAVTDTLRISRVTTEKLHHFGFKLAEKRKRLGKPGKLTCVDKANVFRSMAFFRQIYDEIAPLYPRVETDYCYVDAQALNLIRQPWQYDVLVMENMFGDILSDLAGALVGGMGMASCGEIGDDNGLFQPAHGSAPDIMGKDQANPLAAILSGALMLDYLAEKSGNRSLSDAATLIDRSVQAGFEQNRLRPVEFGQDMGTQAITQTLVTILAETAAQQ